MNKSKKSHSQRKFALGDKDAHDQEAGAEPKKEFELTGCRHINLSGSRCNKPVDGPQLYCIDHQ